MAPEAAKEDPRVARTRAAVLAAGTELLVEQGVNGITVDEIVHRTGIAKTTIYRHWRSKSELVVEIVARQAFDFPSPDTGDALDDLRICLRALSAALAERTHRVALLGVLELSARDQDAAAAHGAFVATQASALTAVYGRAVETGRIPAERDAREVLESLVGPIVLRGLFLGEALADDEIDRLIERAAKP